MTPTLLLWPAVAAVFYAVALSNVVTAVAERNVVLAASPRRASWAVEAAPGPRRIRLGTGGRLAVIAGLGIGFVPVTAAGLSPIVMAYDGVLLCVLVALSIVDAWEYRIPDRIVLPAIAATATLVLGAAFARGADAPLGGFEDLEPLAALVGAGCFALIIGVPHVARPDAMGLGDVKLAVLLGAAIGLHGSDWIETVAAVGWAVVLAAGIGLAVAAWTRLDGHCGGSVGANRHGGSVRANRPGVVPFGPPLSLGAWLVIVAGL